MKKRFILVFDIILVLLSVYFISFSYLEINSNFETNSNPQVMLHVINQSNDNVNGFNQNQVVNSPNIVAVNKNNSSTTDVTSPLVADSNPPIINTTPSYTLKEVSIHNNKSDCWMVVLGKVYNATSYIKKHPGGSDILKGCGLDATQMFAQIHSSKAYQVLVPYYIGDLI